MVWEESPLRVKGFTVEHMDEDLNVWVCGARAVSGWYAQFAAANARVNGGAVVWEAQVGARCNFVFL